MSRFVNGGVSMGIGGDMTTTSIPNEPRRRLWRSRWAAIGAAIAVTFGGGGLFVANAASSVPSSVVTIDPVRILDTRNPVNVGLPGPFVSAVSQKLQVSGPVPTTTGTQTPVPDGSTGVLLNVTVVSPSADGFLSVRPGDATGAPSTSSLNFTAGDIVPNSVQVGLPTAGANAGQIDITYDAFGQAGPTTDVLIDIVGYYTNATLKELDTRVTALEAKAGLSAFAGGQSSTPLGADAVVKSVSLMPTADGQVLVNSSGYLLNIGVPNAPLTGRCSITTGTTVDLSALELSDDHLEILGGAQQIGGTRGFNVTSGVLLTVNYVCDVAGGTGEIDDAALTAIFTATPTP
jgi:hypothetical protein